MSEASERLKAAGIDSARLDAEVLMAEVLKCRRLALYVHLKREMTAEQVIEYDELTTKRCDRIPIAYLTGHKEFMGLELEISPAVLVPRPDTEILAQKTIEHLQNFDSELKLADLGTGSGAICISILKFVENVTAAAVDISAEALKVATRNAKKFNVEDRITFYEGDLFEPLKGQKFDVIVSNPPYIKSGEFGSIQAEVKKEPRIALDGGEDGLDYYRRIVKESAEYLTEDGFLAVEVGYNQSDEVYDLIKENGNFEYIQTWKDMANIERVVAAWRH